MSETPAWGIHVTTTSIRGVKLARQGDLIHVVAHDQADFTDDIDDVDGLEKLGPLLHALATFQKRHDFDRCRVFVSIDGSTAFNRFVTTALVKDESLAKILAYEAQQQVPFDLATVFWDYKSIDVRPDQGEADVLLFAVRKDVVDERLRKLAKMRFPVDGLQLAPVALYNFAAAEGLAREGTVIVAVDHDRVEIVIIHGRRFWFRCLPTGMHVLFEELEQTFDLPHRQIAKILRGEAPPPDKARLERAAKDLADRLASQIAQVISYYSGAIDEVRLEKLLLVPCGITLPGLGKALREKTLLTVERLGSPGTIRLDPAIATPEIAKNFAPYAHAAGLALQGVGAAETAVRLYPEELERVISGRRVFHVLSALTLLILVGLMAMRVRQYQKDIDDAGSRLNAKLGVSEAGRQIYEKARAETRIKDALLPYREPGRHRLAAPSAADMVLTAVRQANEARSTDQQLYIVSLETKASSGEAADQPGCRRVDFVLGMILVDSPEQHVEAVRSALTSRFENDLRCKKITPGAPWIASSLSPAATPEVESKELRRKFVMVPLVLDYDQESSGMGEDARG